MSPTDAAVRARPAWLPLAPVLFVGLWSMGFVMAVVGQTSAGPMTLLALRYIVCALVVLPLVPILSVAFPRDPGTLALIALNGLLIHVVYFGACWIALHRGVPVGVIALVLSLQPVLTALLAPALAGEAVTRRVWAGLVLGLAGTSVVIAARGELGAFPPEALVLVLASLIAFTSATLLDRRFGGSSHPVAVNVVQFLAAVAATVPLALAMEGVRFEVTAALLGAIAYLSLANSLLGLTVFLVMVRFGEAARVTSLLYLVPPVAAVLAWVFLGEPVPPVLWAGMAVASAGVWLALGTGGLSRARR